jgi:hypothetical protein
VFGFEGLVVRVLGGERSLLGGLGGVWEDCLE